jgi:glutaredoxin
MNLTSRKNISLFLIPIFIFATLILSPSSQVSADSSIRDQKSLLQDQKKVIIYLFWGDGCPHCAVAKPFLERLDASSDQIELQKYEVWYVEENQNLFMKMAQAHGFEPQYVPTIFIGDRYWQGYNDQIEAEIQSVVDGCLQIGCPDAGAGVLNDTIPIADPPEKTQNPGPDESESKSITLPIIGSIDLSSQSLLVSTLLISFVDGFNPCSVWVLTMLLALTLHTGSRKKVLLIGLIFLTVTAAVYGLFITGLFSMLTIVSFSGWIQFIVAIVALFFALVNIKDYFWYKEGVSFTISDKKKPGIYQRIRKLMDAGQSFWGLVGGTVVLAAGVSLVEFSCTAGFPVLWSNLLVSQSIPVALFVVLLLIYLLIYQLDELGIFLIAVFSMRASRLEEKQGRILKLVGGILMLTLAGVMLIKPSLMNELSSSLIIFGAAFGITALILLVHRLILPKLGIYIGSEFELHLSKSQQAKGKD